jgi:hypothetical protein
MVPYQGSVFHPTSNKVFVELRVGNEKKAYLLCIFAKSKTGSEKKQIIHSDYDVQVCGKYVDVWKLLFI